MSPRYFVCLAAVAAAATLLAGCGGRAFTPKTPKVVRNTQTPDAALERYNAFVKQYDSNINTGKFEAARPWRNLAVSLALAEVEDVYGEFENRLFVNHAGFQIGTDVLELGLAAVSTVSNGERGKTILAAILSGVAGTRLSVDKNLFRQQTVQAVTAAMRANRDRLRTRIHKRLQSDAVEEYPLEAARADVVELFFAGTLQGALQHLHQQASAEAQDRQATLDNVMAEVTTTDLVAARRLRAAIPEAMKTPEGLDQIRNFLEEMGVQNTSSMTPAQLGEALRPILHKINSPEERKSVFDAARRTRLIQ